MLSIHVPDAKRLYRPGDEIHGIAKLVLKAPMLVSEITINMYCSCLITVYTSSGHGVPLQDQLIDSVRSLYRGDPPLEGAEYSWPFSFKLDDDASLPPTFSLLKAPESSTCVAWIRYGLRAAVIGSDMYTEKLKAEGVLYYCPLRMTSLPEGPLPVTHLKTILIASPEQPDLTAEDPSKRRLSRWFSNGSASKPSREDVELGIHLPRFIILQDPVLAHLTLHRPRKPETLVMNVVLNEICYTLTSAVSMRSNKGVRKVCNTLHIHRTMNLRSPFIDGRCDLTGDAGYTPKPVHEPSGIAQASVCPSFGNDMLSVTYQLVVHVKLSCAGQQVWVDRAVQDVILLPTQLHPSVKERLPEADDDARALPNEADPAAAVYEMEVPPVELEAQYGHDAPAPVLWEVEEAATRRPELAPGAVDLQRQSAAQRIIKRKPLHIREELA